MEYPYSIDDLSGICGVSKQSIYSLLSKNQELVNNNSTRHGRKKKYGQAVLDYLTDYYELPEVESIAEEPAKEEPSSNSPETAEIIANLESRIKELENLLAMKEAQLDRCEAERQEFIKQNGALILALHDEQQTAKALLPAPRRSWFSRFSKK